MAAVIGSSVKMPQCAAMAPATESSPMAAAGTSNGAVQSNGAPGFDSARCVHACKGNGWPQGTAHTDQ